MTLTFANVFLCLVSKDVDLLALAVFDNGSSYLYFSCVLTDENIIVVVCGKYNFQVKRGVLLSVKKFRFKNKSLRNLVLLTTCFYNSVHRVTSRIRVSLNRGDRRCLLLCICATQNNPFYAAKRYFTLTIHYCQLNCGIFLRELRILTLPRSKKS